MVAGFHPGFSGLLCQRHCAFARAALLRPSTNAENSARVPRSDGARLLISLSNLRAKPPLASAEPLSELPGGGLSRHHKTPCLVPSALPAPALVGTRRGRGLFVRRTEKSKPRVSAHGPGEKFEPLRGFAIERRGSQRCLILLVKRSGSTCEKVSTPWWYGARITF
jgi:hypothetical protein